MAVWGTVGGSGLAAGALLGGLLTDALGWQWVFFVNVPLALGAALGAPRVLPPDGPAKGGGFDLAGALLATLGSCLLVVGLVGGPEQGWGSLAGAGALSAGAAMLAAFLLLESRIRNPLLPPRLLTHRRLVTAAAVMFIVLGSVSGAFYVFTLYLQNVLGYDALAAGLAFLPLTVISMLSSERLMAPLLNRWGLRATLASGLFLHGAGMIVFAFGISDGGSFWGLLPGIVIWGLGGYGFPAMYVAATSGIEPAQQGVAAGLASTALQIGGAVGLAVIVAVTGIGAEHATAAAGAVDGLRTAASTAGLAMITASAVAFTLKAPAATAHEPLTRI
ncbi:MFS transporter [Nonomuraea antimicrobica]